jgi:hypothetical protein
LTNWGIQRLYEEERRSSSAAIPPCEPTNSNQLSLPLNRVDKNRMFKVSDLLTRLTKPDDAPEQHTKSSVLSRQAEEPKLATNQRLRKRNGTPAHAGGAVLPPRDQQRRAAGRRWIRAAARLAESREADLSVGPCVLT